MNAQQSGRSSDQVVTVARIIHFAIAGGLVLVFGVFFYLQPLMSSGSVPATTTP